MKWDIQEEAKSWLKEDRTSIIHRNKKVPVSTEQKSQSACSTVILTSVHLHTDDEMHSCSTSCSHVLKILSRNERESYQWLHQRTAFHQQSGGTLSETEITQAVGISIASSVEWSSALLLVVSDILSSVEYYGSIRWCDNVVIVKIGKLCVIMDVILLEWSYHDDTFICMIAMPGSWVTPFWAEMNVQMTSHSVLVSATKSGKESNGRFLSFDIRDDVVIWSTE